MYLEPESWYSCLGHCRVRFMKKILRNTIRGGKAALMAVLYLSVSSAWGDNVPFDSIPFELEKDGRVYVKGAVNGSQPFRFMLDTGATDLIINPESTKGKVDMTFDAKVTNTGTTGVSEVKKSSSNTFCLGNQTFKGAPFLSISYAPELWDGVIGLWFIRQQVTEINYDQRKINLYEHGSYAPPANAIKLKVEYVLDLPVVPVQVTVNGKTHSLRLEVDTGSDRVLDLNTPFVQKHGLEGTQEPFSISYVSGSEKEVGILKNVIFENIKIGAYCLPRIPGAFSTLKQGIQSSAEMDGVMGNNLLKRFNLVCDLKEGYIYLIPNDLLYTPFYDCLVAKPEAVEKGKEK